MRAKFPNWAEMLACIPCCPHPGFGCIHCSKPGTLAWASLYQGVSALALLTFGARSFFVVEAITCTVGCSAASLASTHSIPLTPSSQCDNQCLHTVSNVPWGQNHS